MSHVLVRRIVEIYSIYRARRRGIGETGARTRRSIGVQMSCYVRHLTDLLAEAGLENCIENRRKLDKAVRTVVAMDKEACNIVWQQVKPRRDDPEFHRLVIGQLQRTE